MSPSKRPASPAADPASRRSPWPALITVALLSGGVGALATYAILLPRLTPPPPLAIAPAAVSFAPAAPDPAVPGPELTAGQAPAAADRTLGNFYYDRSDWAQAARYYESALRLGSDDADIRTDLGNAYRFSNRRDDALAQYRAAQRLNPQHEFSLFNQGGLLFDQFQDSAAAIAIWQEYLRRFPAGSNVAAARQLIAEAQGGPAAAGAPSQLQKTSSPSTATAAPAPVGVGSPNAPDPVEARLMQLVKPKP